MNENDPRIEKMKIAAWEASEKAYVPYSNFPVGAAVLTEGGQVFSGCNVSNASYGLGMCAERVAVFKAVSSGYTTIEAVVVVTPTDGPTPPCGACRQVINEFGSQAHVFSFDESDSSKHWTLKELLPDAFGPGNL